MPSQKLLGCGRLAGRVLIGITVGVAIAVIYWAVLLLLNGHGIVEALQGRVEDALGGLQGLACLGVVVGAFVGFIWTIVSDMLRYR